MRTALTLSLFWFLCLSVILPPFAAGNDKFLAETPLRLTVDMFGDTKTCEPIEMAWLGVSGNRVMLNESNGGCNDIWIYNIATDSTIKINDPDHETEHKIKGVIDGDMVFWSYLKNNRFCSYNLSTETLSCDNLNSTSDIRISWPYVIYRTANHEIVARDYSASPPIDRFVVNGNLYPADYFDISGTKVVWTSRHYSGTGGLYITDIFTGEQIRLGDSTTTWEPKISGNLVVWTDWGDRRGNISSYDLSTGIERQITNDYTQQLAPTVSDKAIVWQDHRNGNPDIYMLDLSSGREIRLTANSADQIYPEINDDKIVWHDYRSGEKEVYLFTSGLNHPELDLTVIPDNTTGDLPDAIAFAGEY